jgi:hypothetical protein
MREIRPSGSEGGGTGTTRPSLPLSLCIPFGDGLPQMGRSAADRWQELMTVTVSSLLQANLTAKIG